MNEAQRNRAVQRALERLDREMMLNNRHPKRRRFQGFGLITPEATDTPEIRRLISEHNHKARSYNRLGGEFTRVAQTAIDKYANRLEPQGDESPLMVLLCLIDERLRMRRATFRPVFQGVDSRLHSLEWRMCNEVNGPRGIHALATRIRESRSGRATGPVGR